MSRDEIADMLERMVAALNDHDIAAMTAMASASDAERDAFEAMMSSFYAAFPDYRITVLDSVIGESSFALFYQVTATHAAEFPFGELAGIVGTGKQLMWNEAVYQAVQDGKLADWRLVVDGAGRLEQLGVLPVSTTGPEAAQQVAPQT